MSLQDQAAFLSNIHPFQVLTSGQMDKCIKHMDIAYYPKDSILISCRAEDESEITLALDKSTAIKFAKTLRTEINKITE